MIVFDLTCAKDHVFEAWFSDSDTFEKQAKAGTVECPVCGSCDIEKAPMAPNIATSKQRKGLPADSGAGGTPSPEHVAQAMKVLRKMQNHVESNFDHVGKKFPEEVRKMHYGESEHRNVYGDATKDEADSLRDEGIDVSQMPWQRHDA